MKTFVIIPGSLDVDFETDSITVGTARSDMSDVKYMKGSPNELLEVYAEGTTIGDIVNSERINLENGQKSVLNYVEV